MSDKTCEPHISFDAKISKGNEHNKKPCPLCKQGAYVHTLMKIMVQVQLLYQNPTNGSMIPP